MSIASTRRDAPGLAVIGALALWFGTLEMAGHFQSLGDGAARLNGSRQTAAAMPMPQARLRTAAEAGALDSRLPLLRRTAGMMPWDLQGELSLLGQPVVTGALAATDGRWMKIDGRWQFAAARSAGIEMANLGRRIDGLAEGEKRWMKRDGIWMFAETGIDHATTASISRNISNDSSTATAIEKRWLKRDGRWVFEELRGDRITTGSISSESISGISGDAAPTRPTNERWVKRDGRWRFEDGNAGRSGLGEQASDGGSIGSCWTRNGLRWTYMPSCADRSADNGIAGDTRDEARAAETSAMGWQKRDGRWVYDSIDTGAEKRRSAAPITTGRWVKVDGNWYWRQRVADDVSSSRASAERLRRWGIVEL